MSEKQSSATQNWWETTAPREVIPIVQYDGNKWWEEINPHDREKTPEEREKIRHETKELVTLFTHKSHSKF